MKEFKDFRRGNKKVLEMHDTHGIDAIAEIGKILGNINTVEIEMPTAGHSESDFDCKFTKAIIALQFQMKFFHWGTSSFAEHEAFGKIYGVLDEAIDGMVESVQGMLCRRIKFDEHMELINYCHLTPDFFDHKVQCIMDLYNCQEMQDPAIKNMLDEILGIVYKLKYLLSLKK
jgi:hypothetical protein